MSGSCKPPDVIRGTVLAFCWSLNRYLVEQSLSVDNLFVFVVLFEYFKVPTEYQDRVLTWGIIGAMVMRAIMVRGHQLQCCGRQQTLNFLVNMYNTC